MRDKSKSRDHFLDDEHPSTETGSSFYCLVDGRRGARWRAHCEGGAGGVGARGISKYQRIAVDCK